MLAQRRSPPGGSHRWLECMPRRPRPRMNGCISARQTVAIETSLGGGFSCPPIASMIPQQTKARMNRTDAEEKYGSTNSGEAIRRVHEESSFDSRLQTSSKEEADHSQFDHDWMDTISILEHSTIPDPEQVTEAMNLLSCKLRLALKDTDEKGLQVMEDLVGRTDLIVRCLSSRIDSTFNSALDRSASALTCKQLLDTLAETFSVKRLACAVKEDTLQCLLSKLLFWMRIDRVFRIGGDALKILKSLKITVLNILENSSPTSVFFALIHLLAQTSQVGNVAFRDAKFTDLIVKYLTDLTGTLPSNVHGVELDQLLGRIHDFFHQRGLEGIRRRVRTEDKPLQMVKALLSEVVILKGAAVRDHLSEVPVDSEPPPAILAYIYLYDTISREPPVLVSNKDTETTSSTPAGPGIVPVSCTCVNAVGSSVNSNERQEDLVESSGNKPSANTTSSAEPPVQLRLEFRSHLAMFICGIWDAVTKLAFSSSWLRFFGYQ